MPTGSEMFLEPLGVSGLRAFIWIHIKKGLVPHHAFGRIYDKYNYTLTKLLTPNSGLSSWHHWRVLYFVNVKKISILFPTLGLVISHSVTFCWVTIYIYAYIYIYIEREREMDREIWFKLYIYNSMPVIQYNIYR